MTLNRIVATVLHHFTQSGSFTANYVKLTETKPTATAPNCSQNVLVFGITWFTTAGACFAPNFSPKTDPLPSFHYSTCATLCGHLSNSRALVFITHSVLVTVYLWLTDNQLQLTDGYIYVVLQRIVRLHWLYANSSRCRNTPQIRCRRWLLSPAWLTAHLLSGRRTDWMPCHHHRLERPALYLQPCLLLLHKNHINRSAYVIDKKSHSECCKPWWWNILLLRHIFWK